MIETLELPIFERHKILVKEKLAKAEKEAEPAIEKRSKESKKIKSKGIRKPDTLETTEIQEEVIEDTFKDVIKVDADFKKAPIKKKVRKEE